MFFSFYRQFIKHETGFAIAIHYNLYNKKTHIHKDEIYRLNQLKKIYIM